MTARSATCRSTAARTSRRQGRPVSSGAAAGVSDTHRDYAYGIHHNHHEGPDYAIRSLTDGHWRYIRNLSFEKPFRLRHITGIPGQKPPVGYWQEWEDAARTDPRARRLVERYTQRPAEELYDTSADPAELRNLIDDPTALETKTRLARALDAWISGCRPDVAGEQRRAERP